MQKLRTFLTIIVLVVLTVLPTGSTNANPQPQAFQSFPNSSGDSLAVPPPLPYKQFVPVNYQTSVTCHFGIAVINSVNGYDLSTLGVGNYLDWNRTRNPSVPSNIDYYRVLNVGDSNYATTKAQLPALLVNNPGATWLIGNEPDSEVKYQDHVSAETYADRYYELATYIRQNDPTATIGFGTVIQPTPIRIYYLTRAMDRLVVDAGNNTILAHSLIDVYSIHSFILNEQQMYDSQGNNINWGAGLPVGYDPLTWPAPEVIDLSAGETYKTFDINIFKTRVIAFRQWMKTEGDQNKPLWITEFGSLFPSQGNVFLQVSDADTANYMAQTYDFMLGYKDPSLGYNGDANRLVQKWTWFSLNQQRDQFGGSLFDPLTHLISPVGERFLQYNPSLTDVPVSNPDVYVMTDSFALVPFAPSITPGRVNYEFNLKFSNYLSSDRSTGVQIDIYDGATLIYSAQAVIPRCGGIIPVEFFLNNMLPGEMHTFTAKVSLLPGNGTDTYPADNTVTFGPLALLAPVTYSAAMTFLPTVYK